MNQTLREQLRHAIRSGAGGEALLRQALAELGTAPEPSWLDYAAALSAEGAAPVAAALLEQALRRWPCSADLRCELGNTLRQSPRREEAEGHLRAALATQPDHERATLSLAFLLRDAGRMDAAAEQVQGLWRRGPRDAAAALKAGRFLQECGRPQRAAEIYEEAIAAGSADPRVLAGAGDMAQVLGDFERSRRRLLAAVAAGLDGRDWTGVALMLANGQKYRDAAHPDFARFARAWADTRLDPAERIAAGFALGKARADVEDYAGAAEVLRQANALQRGRRPWDAAAWARFVPAQIAAPPLPQLPDDPSWPVPAPIPVFVVGLPRTGTTLVAEKLAAHPQVRGRGEMNWLPRLAHELASARRLHDPGALRQAAGIYMGHLRQDDPPARWYLDKNPHNFRHLGLAQALFPHARVILCRRDRRDTALSIWSQLFAHPDVDYAYDFADIAAFAAGHDRLVEHWCRSLRLPIHELRYEELVSAPEDALRRLREFLGIGEAAAVASPATAISTASVWQARQPVYRSAVGRWRAWAPHLPELERLIPSAAG